MFLSIQPSSLLLLVAFWLISTTVARAVGENLELDQTNADLLRKPSIPQPLATSSTPEGNGYELIDHSLETPQQQPSNPLSISTANLDTTISALGSPSSQQLGADKVPDTQYRTQPITPPEGLVPEDVAFFPSCPDGLDPVCAWGEPFYDFWGNMHLRECYYWVLIPPPGSLKRGGKEWCCSGVNMLRNEGELCAPLKGTTFV